MKSWITVVTLVVALCSAARATQVEHGNARFTVITPNLIRIEHSPDQKFVDEPSMFAIARDARFDARVERGEKLSIVTDHIRLTYDGGQLDGSLRAQIKHGDRWIDWTPTSKQTGNLGGTIRTLDGVSGPVDLGHGLLSRDGWFLLDDSRTPLLTDGWVKSRPKDAGTDWYLFAYGTDYRAALKSLAAISGPVPMPRKYMLGAWYSRYWNYSADDYKKIVEEYKQHDFPLDVIVMDMDWHLTRVPGVRTHHANQVWTGYTWDKELIPDPAGLIKWFHDQGLRITLNDHPADGVQPHEEMYEAFMRDMGQDPSSKQTIPFDAGDKKYLDTFWKHTHQPHLDIGVDFWWLDWQQYPFTRSIADLTNLAWLNHYFYAQTATNGKRGASFSRWAGWGDHRHPIHFSGDADTGWQMLAFQVPFTSTAGNVGCFFWSHDIGGHMGGRNEESYARWCQFGALTAALRSHSTRDAQMDRRPWKYEPWATESMRRSFHLRSRLFPYLYSAVAQSCRETVPLTRPMYIDYPTLDDAYKNPQQFMLGDHLLVAPITGPGTGEQRVGQQVVWFPPGDDWYDFFTGEKHEGGTERLVSADINTFPLFVRGGAAIVMQPYTPRMTSAALETLVIRVYPGRDGESRTTTLYEDDGVTTAYQRGERAETDIVYTRRGDEQVVEVKPTRGSFTGQLKSRKVIVEFAGKRTDPVDAPLAEGCRVSISGLHPAPRTNVSGVFDKNESPSGYPHLPRRYLYLDPTWERGGDAVWKIVQEADGQSRLLFQTTSRVAGSKVALPDLPKQPRPADLHAPLHLTYQVKSGLNELHGLVNMSVMDPVFNAARDAKVSASSVEQGYSPAGAIDGRADGYPRGKHLEWASRKELAGATLKLEWDQPQRVDVIWLHDRPNDADQVTSATITFDDGSTLNVGELPNDGRKPAELRFEPKTVRWLELKITGVSASTQNAGLSEIAVFRAADR